MPVVPENARKRPGGTSFSAFLGGERHPPNYNMSSGQCPVRCLFFLPRTLKHNAHPPPPPLAPLTTVGFPFCAIYETSIGEEGGRGTGCQWRFCRQTPRLPHCAWTLVNRLSRQVTLTFTLMIENFFFNFPRFLSPPLGAPGGIHPLSSSMPWSKALCLGQAKYFAPY